MKCKHSALFIVTFLLGIHGLYAGSPVVVKPVRTETIHQGGPVRMEAIHPGGQFINHQDWSFVENKGQITNQNIKYYGHQGGVYLYCKPGLISFVFTKVEQEPGQISEATSLPSGFPLSQKGAGGFSGRDAMHRVATPSKITTSRTDLVLLHSNPNAEIVASDQQEYYENFYTSGDANHGITNVHTYKTITYKNIYPHIDIVLRACPNGSSGLAKSNGMEYEFIVYPNGKVSDIQMQWNGLADMKMTDDGGMIYASLLGSMKEGRPVSFQAGNQIGSRFFKSDNIVGFKVGKYDKTKPLVIDPTLIWGTYFGGSGEEQAFAVSTDRSGNAYITGFTKSNNGIATSGAYQTLYAQPFYSDEGDVFLSKFNSKGAIQWATYYGGKGGEIGIGVTTDASGNVFITGATYSDSGIATSGAFQTSYSGMNNSSVIFVAKFNSSGFLSWGTYYGGDYEGDGEGRSICSDSSGNVYITGITTSKTGIATSGVYQTSLGGNDDAFLVKFSNAGNLEWGTYFGGNSSDYGYGVNTDKLGNIYLGGNTISPKGIATSGAYLTSIEVSHYHVFIAKFNSSGDCAWATYYGGKNQDYAQAICTDTSGNAYITGGTLSTTGIATAGSFQTSYSGGSDEDAFIAKFGSSGSLVWATYFGSYDEGIGIATDPLGKVYITGSVEQGINIASSGAFQTTVRGVENAFLAQFNSSGKRSYATYYGTDDDVAYGICADRSQNIYITGYSGSSSSSSSMATSGAYQTTNAGYTDAFLVKFGFKNKNDAGISSFQDPKNNFCPDTQAVSVQLMNYGTNELDSVTIYTSVNGSQLSRDAWKGKLLPDSAIMVAVGRFWFTPGKESIKSWTSMPNGAIDSVPENDTSATVVNVLALPKVGISPNKSICTNSADTISAAALNSNIYLWTSNPAGFHSTLPRAVVAPLSKTIYYCTVTSTITGCSNSDSVVVSLIPLPSPDPGPNQTICDGNKIGIGKVSMNGDTYSWISNPPGWDIQNLTDPFASVDPTKTTTFYLIETNDSTGCSKTDSVVITVNPLPVPGTVAAQSICIGDIIEIGKSSVNGYSYVWKSFPVGFSSSVANPSVNPATNTIYILKETIDSTGCQRIDSVKISVKPLPVPEIDSAHYTICTGTHIRIGGNEVANLTYSWVSQPKGFTSSMSGPIVNPVGNITYFLKVTDTATGCINSDTAKVTVTVPKAPVANAGLSEDICHGNQAVIGADPIDGLSFSWASDPYGFTSSSAKAVVQPDTTTTYYLTVKNAIGCTDLAAVTIKVNPLPVVNPGIPQKICSGTVIQLGAPPVAGNDYAWRSNPPGFSSSLSNPIDSPKITTTYYLKQTIATTGCADSDSVMITVVPRPNVVFDIKNINGFQYQFTANNPNWPQGLYHWDFGDSGIGANDTASGYIVTHTYSVNGKYTVTLTVSVPGFCTETLSYQVVINETFSLNIYPNPFYTQTDINYTLVKPAHIKISVVDEIGRQLGTLLDKQLPQGEYDTNFDAGFWKTRPAMYFILFQIDDKLIVKKMIQLGSIYY